MGHDVIEYIICLLISRWAPGGSSSHLAKGIRTRRGIGATPRPCDQQCVDSEGHLVLTLLQPLDDVVFR